MTSEQGLRVLIVEDHEPTAQLIAAVLEDTMESLSTLIVGDGKACLEVLENDDSWLPDLVLLDLDLPVLTGKAVLKRRQEEISFSRIPTIILSNTDDHGTIRQCYECGANAFIAKPGDLDEFDTVAKRITNFWFNTAALPTG